MNSVYNGCPEQYDCHSDDYLSELDRWFLVSGDTDDFIFYGEQENAHSEK